MNAVILHKPAAEWQNSDLRQYRRSVLALEVARLSDKPRQGCGPPTNLWLISQGGRWLGLAGLIYMPKDWFPLLLSLSLSLSLSWQSEDWDTGSEILKMCMSWIEEPAAKHTACLGIPWHFLAFLGMQIQPPWHFKSVLPDLYLSPHAIFSPFLISSILHH